MRVYFHDSAIEPDKNSQMINKYLRQVGATVFSESAIKKTADDLQSSMEKVDALIIYGTTFDAQGGYWLAWAIAKNKDVLCLLPAGVKIDPALERLQADPKAAQQMHLEHYNAGDVLEKVANFLEKLGHGNLSEYFNIKYTLRLSRKINEYLEWKSKETSIDKATWLRQQIQKTMEQDADFQKFVNNKFKIKS